MANVTSQARVLTDRGMNSLSLTLEVIVFAYSRSDKAYRKNFTLCCQDANVQMHSTRDWKRCDSGKSKKWPKQNLKDSVSIC